METYEYKKLLSKYERKCRRVSELIKQKERHQARFEMLRRSATEYPGTLWYISYLQEALADLEKQYDEQNRLLGRHIVFVKELQTKLRTYEDKKRKSTI